MVEWLANYWYLIITAIAIGAVAGIAIYRFIKLPTDAQLQKVREWLLYAVTIAEKELGGGTGKLKLRQVYDMFLTKFPWLAKVISFAVFSTLVDEALEEMRRLLHQNEQIQNFVEEK